MSVDHAPAPKPPEPKFTYADYVDWPDDERWEIIRGKPYAMSPAPRRVHQDLLLELSAQLATQLRGKECRPYVAPFDVRFPEPLEELDKSSTVVQPDVTIFCDRGKLDERGAVGAPTFIAEILSPSTRRKDRSEKLDLYEAHGVQEYWIVDPELRSVEVWLLDEQGKYGEPELLAPEGTKELTSVPDVAIDLATLFAAID